MREVVLAIIASGLLSVIVTEVSSHFKEKRRKKSKEVKGIRMCLYVMIKDRGRSYLKQGYITAEDLEDMIMMHKVYHDDLGGNGYLDQIMTQVKQLNIVDLNSQAITR